jgi:hypothetical protein
MKTEDKIKGVLMELKHGYDEALVTKLHLLRADLKREKEEGNPRTKVYGEDIRPLTVHPII